MFIPGIQVVYLTVRILEFLTGRGQVISQSAGKKLPPPGLKMLFKYFIISLLNVPMLPTVVPIQGLYIMYPSV